MVYTNGYGVRLPSCPECAALRAEVARLRDPWQPIATAPRDDTFMLLYNKRWIFPVLYGRWSVIFGNWRVMGELVEMAPTHWAPAPTPPAALKEA